MSRLPAYVAEAIDMSERHAESQRLEEQTTPEQKPGVRSWTSVELLGQSQEARIQHGGETYRLLRTRNDKLILVK